MLSLAAAAKRLSLSRDYLYAAARRLEFPVYRFGRAWRIEESDLMAWVADDGF